MLLPNSLITAPQQAGKAPICSGSTTCCATTSPLAFIRAQEASCDSRTMVEKPVRNSEFCISCTIPESDAFTTSKSIASTCINDSFVEGGNRCRELGRLPSHLWGRAGERGTPLAPHSWWATVFPSASCSAKACRRLNSELWAYPSRCPSPTRGEGTLWHYHSQRHGVSASRLSRHDQVLPFIDTRSLAGVDHGRAIKLIENRRTLERQSDVELLALVHRACHVLT